MIRPEAPRRRVLLGVPVLVCVLALATATTAAGRQLQLAKSSGGWFGVMVMDLFPESAAARGFGEGRGILVTAVLPGSPAERAGLRPNDIVLEIDGRRLIWYKSMIALVQSLPADRTVEVLIARAGERLRTSVALGDLEAARAGIRSRDAMSRDYKAGIAAYGAGRHAEAAEVFEGLVDHGWAGARFALGLLYQEGQGRPRDPARAAHWYRLAAKQGETSAQHNLGQLYRNGDGVARDLAHAYYWVKRAVDGGGLARLSSPRAHGRGAGAGRHRQDIDWPQAGEAGRKTQRPG
ncbi:MAG: PDZ domain-containing protein [Alphaproteobacteria bacterium]|jgi:hypothetical protein|nr:PDZ domain-containing protein [Alphaproteobacteria bacterium]